MMVYSAFKQMIFCGLSILSSQTFAAEAITPWSLRMIESVMLRQQGVISSGASTGTIASGALVLALNSAMGQYPEKTDTYSSYRQQVLNLACSGLVNETADALLPLDRFSIVNGIRDIPNSDAYARTSIQDQGLEALDASLDLQPRNYLGGLWYYAAYREWSYLDGMFSILPYLALQPSPNITEIGLQLSLLYSHCLDTQSGLVVHGYDASRTAVWANRISGASSYVWGRSLAWYLTGLVQTYEILCYSDVGHVDSGGLCATISSLFTSLTFAFVPYADNTTGAWFQLPTFPDRPGNWLESSSTVLFVFTMLKALRLGLLPSDLAEMQMVTNVALKAFQFTIDSGQFVQEYGNGTIGLNATVAVCSLNSTATYEYYTGRPIEENSLIGEAGFILAALEVERLNAEQRS